MELVPKIRTKTSSVVDFIGAGAVKAVTEPMFAGIVGDGNFVSGTVKAVVAGLISGKGGRIGNMVALGVGVDAGEDIALSLMGMLGVGGKASTGSTATM